MLRTSTPRSCATLFRLKSLVTIFPCSVRASSINFRSTSLDVREIGVGHLNIHTGHLLNLLQNIEAAAAAVALHRIGRVGDELQLLQHELRDDERPVHESGLADVRDPAVDDDAGVEHLVSPARARRAEDADEVFRLEPLTLAGAHHEAKVRKREQDEAVKEDDAVVAEIGPVHRVAQHLGGRQSDCAAKEAAQHVGDGRFLEAHLQPDDEAAEDDAEGDVHRSAAARDRLKLICRVAD